MKTTRNNFAALCVTATAFGLCLFNLPAAEDSPTVTAILNKYAHASQLSPALEAIVKLSKAGVAESVTLAYIQASPTPYSLDAQDILRLRERGVASQVVTAMMQHGDELRRAAAEASKQTTTSASAPTYQSTAPAVTAPTPATVTYVQAPSYPASSVSVTYIGYPRYNSYSGYYGYGYGGAGYPTYYSYAPQYGYGYCGPRIGFGVGYRGVYAGYSRGYYGGYGRCR